MKTVRCITCLIGLAVFVGLENPRAYAQAEVDPDHYETRDPEPLQQANTNAPSPVDKIHYAGNFVLPYRLQCNRSSLASRQILNCSRVRTVNVTVSRKGHSTKIEVITKRKRPNHRRSILVVERNGSNHQLSVIQVAQSALLFSPTLGFEHPVDRKRRNIQELLLISADSRR